MAIDIVALAEFYASPLGLVTQRLIRRRIGAIWPSVKGLNLLGFGYTTPFLRNYTEEAQRCIALMPAAQGVMRWPKAGPNLAGLAEETALPLEDASFERILLVHALEHSWEVRPLLREVWRVLAPEGRLLVIVPHRRSPWAASERTPFGHGQPYSSTQIARLLEDGLFEPARPQNALFLPPSSSRLVLGSSSSWERFGEWLWPGFGGVVLIEAAKRVYATPSGMKEKRRILIGAPAAAPLPAGISPATSETPQTQPADWRKSSVG